MVLLFFGTVHAYVARALHCKPSSDGVPEYIRRQILVCTMSDIIQIMLYCPMPVAFPSAATDKQTEFCAAIFLPPLPLSRMFPKKTEISCNWNESFEFAVKDELQKAPSDFVWK